MKSTNYLDLNPLRICSTIHHDILWAGHRDWESLFENRLPILQIGQRYQRNRYHDFIPCSNLSVHRGRRISQSGTAQWSGEGPSRHTNGRRTERNVQAMSNCRSQELTGRLYGDFLYQSFEFRVMLIKESQHIGGRKVMRARTNPPW